MRTISAINILLLLLGIAMMVTQICAAFPVPNPDRNTNGVNEGVRQQPPDKCRRGVCENKGRICEVICKNNPSEGGKFCNCDTYALRAKGPSFGDCNRLI